MPEQTPFDRAVAEAAQEMREELEAARAKAFPTRRPWWKRIFE